MDYDVWGSWSTSVGPNAPLDDSCSSTPEGSAMSAVKAWTAAGFPASQIVLGVASYGHSFYVMTSAAMAGSMLAINAPFDKSMQPHGDNWDADAGTDQCGNPTPIGGIFDFWGLVEKGFLNNNGTTAPGMDFRYDDCSQTVSRGSRFRFFWCPH
jgi:chitinase